VKETTKTSAAYVTHIGGGSLTVFSGRVYILISGEIES
jgi:hypothetical protein